MIYLEKELENLENALNEACRILVRMKYCPAEYLFWHNKRNKWACKRDSMQCNKEEKIKCWKRNLLAGKLKRD